MSDLVKSSSYVEAHMTKSLEGHELKLVSKSDHFECYRMGRPGTGIYAAYITFMNHGKDPEGVEPRGSMTVISGDIILCEHTNAVASGYGYGKNWFSQQLSEGYLCEKFLRRCWSKEAAIRDLKREAEDIRRNRDGDALDIQVAKDLDQLAKDAEHGELDQGAIYEAYTDLMGSHDNTVGYDYPLASAGWLCAVQRRFHELIQAAP